MSTTVLGLSADHLSHTRSTDELLADTRLPLILDPSFVFDFRSYDDPDCRPPALVHLAAMSSHCAAARSRGPTGS